VARLHLFGHGIQEMLEVKRFEVGGMASGILLTQSVDVVQSRSASAETATAAPSAASAAAAAAAVAAFAAVAGSAVMVE